MNATPALALTDRDVRFGDDSIELVGSVADRLGADRVLLVRGSGSFTASGADRLLPGLERAAKVEQWSGFAPNTDVADLETGLTLAARFDPDLIVGVGGGSVMDMAKLLCACRGLTDRERLHERIRAGATVTERTPRLVLAPTTSGSGSEATHFAVVYIGDEKFSVAGPAMLPDAVVLDPSLTASGSPYQRATSGIDAIAQAVESRWAKGATDASRGYARTALGLLVPAVEAFVRDPDPASARAMALGAHLAGRAIDLSKTTAAHALSYGITKRHGLSHGHAVAVTLGAFIETHAEAGPDRLQDGIDPAEHRAAIDDVLAAFGASDGPAARTVFNDLLDRIGLDPRLSAIEGLTDHDRRTLAAAVNAQRLGNNPVAFDAAALAALMLSLP